MSCMTQHLSHLEQLSGNDARLKVYNKTITYSLSFTSKTVLKIFPLRRYTEVLVFSVDTKVQKSKLILKNDVSLPCRELARYRGGIGMGIGKVCNTPNSIFGEWYG